MEEKDRFRSEVERRTGLPIPAMLEVLINSHVQFCDKLKSFEKYSSAHCKGENQALTALRACKNQDCVEDKAVENLLNSGEERSFPSNSGTESNLIMELGYLLEMVLGDRPKKGSFMMNCLSRHCRSKIESWKRDPSLFASDFLEIQNRYFQKSRKRRRGRRSGKRAAKRRCRKNGMEPLPVS